MRESALDSRLRSAAEYVRQGARFADIGTDHARLPVFLIRQGKITSAIASDVAEGPLLCAGQTVAEAGLSGAVELLLSDGVSALADRSLTDISICGMGGELIASILATAPFLRDPKIRLILQPMTRAGHLRRWLAKNGFAIESEAFSLAAGRAYVCLCVAFDGKTHMLTPTEEEIGQEKCWKNPKTPSFYALASARYRSLRKEADGLRRKGDFSAADRCNTAADGIQPYLPANDGGAKGETE